MNIVDDESTAEECENDTYLKVWNSIPPHKPYDYLLSFVSKITRQIALDRYREAHRQKRNAEMVELTSELSDIIAGNDDVEGSIQETNLSEQVSNFLRTIPSARRNIFLRRYWFMDSVNEIASRYSISQSKVKTSLFRTRNELKKYLEKEGYSL